MGRCSLLPSRVGSTIVRRPAGSPPLAAPSPARDIDIDRLAQCIPGRTLSHDELFALAERESRRPGCQFGVLLRLMREDKVLGVYWKEQEQEE